MSILIQVSLRKKNRESEKAKLIEAGVTTAWLQNEWYHLYLTKMYSSNNLYAHLTGARGYRYNMCNLIVNADQFSTIVAMQKLNPSWSIPQLLQTIKLTKRNKAILIRYGYGSVLNLI